jgi:TRAP-type C4-dicarboxylate transport system substrate-binding protein
MSLEKFNSLPEDLQQILLETAADLEEYAHDTVTKRALEIYDNIEKEGIEVHFPTEEEVDHWKEFLEPVYDMYIKEVPDGKELVDEVRRLGEELAK